MSNSRRWTCAGDARLMAMHAETFSVKRMALELGRSEGAIKSRLQKHHFHIEHGKKCGGEGFNYVNVVGKGCEGWLNLFHNGDIVCLVRVVIIADEIRQTTPERIKTFKSGEHDD